MEIIIQQNGQKASHAAARVVAQLMHEKPDVVLGLATGSTPLMLYTELIRMHREDGLDFSRTATFNLDEYVGLEKKHPRSYHSFMRENFFRYINIKPENVHIPDGMAANIPSFCASYEKAILDAGGIDLQVLGIGSNGHIGFNEPTSSFSSRTRIKTLAKQTVADNARFFDEAAQVPLHGITMGIGTIMDARTCLMLAFGKDKAAAVAAMIEGPVSSMVPASILQHHPDAKIFIDEAAARKLRLIDYYRWIYEHKPKG